MRACNIVLGEIPVNQMKWRNRVAGAVLCLSTVFALTMLPHATYAATLNSDAGFDVAVFMQNDINVNADGGGGGGVGGGGGGGGGVPPVPPPVGPVCQPAQIPAVVGTIDAAIAAMNNLARNSGQLNATKAALDAVSAVNSEANTSGGMRQLQDALQLEYDYLRTLRTITVQEAYCAPAGTMVTTYPREGCILSGTPITLADGTTKPIEALNLNDEVKGYLGPVKIIALNKFTQREDFMYSINGGEAFFTVEHPILTPKGWKSIDSTITSVKSDIKIIGTLKVGDTVLTADRKEVVVKSIDKHKISKGVDAYNISTEGDGSFVANGYIMKGFKNVQMHY
jgi:hypothetical protein